MEKTVGVLGGMGPEATAIFYRKIVKFTPACSDQQHLKVIIFSNPKIPDRNCHLEHSTESPLPALIESARKLELAGADFIAIPCNTVHWLWPQLSEAVHIPILNIVEETVDAIRKDREATPRETSAVGVLATDGTLRQQLYHRALRAAGLEPLVPSSEVQEKLQQSIYAIKRGEAKEAQGAAVQEAVDALQEQGAGCLIYGCTELMLTNRWLSPKVPVYDSLELLARATVAFARNQA